MRREYSNFEPRDLRNQLECGIEEAKKIVKTSRLLDALEEAKTIDDLRSLFMCFITMQTGIN